MSNFLDNQVAQKHQEMSEISKEKLGWAKVIQKSIDEYKKVSPSVR